MQPQPAHSALVAAQAAFRVHAKNSFLATRHINCRGQMPNLLCEVAAYCSWCCCHAGLAAATRLEAAACGGGAAVASSSVRGTCCWRCFCCCCRGAELGAGPLLLSPAAAFTAAPPEFASPDALRLARLLAGCGTGPCWPPLVVLVMEPRARRQSEHPPLAAAQEKPGRRVSLPTPYMIGRENGAQ